MQLTRRSLLFGAGGVPLLGNPAEPVKKHLVLDSRIIESTEGVRLSLGKAIKERRNPLFSEDKPWEPRFDNLYPNALWDSRDKRFKCWYSPFIVDPPVRDTPREMRKTIPYRANAPGREMGLCYAVSRDGVAWEKPDLGLVEFEGSRKNNLVKRGPHGAGVFIDPHDPDPAKRYKMFYVLRGRNMFGTSSPDGLRWSDPVEFPEIAAPADTHNNAFWAPELNRYVGITRLRARGPFQRVVGRCESPDFVKWTRAVEVFRALPDEQPHRQTYGMPVFRYANLYLGLVTMLDTRNETVDCELAWSADTVAWERVCPGESLIPRGPKGSYDYGCVYAAACPVVRQNEILLYYGGSNGPHIGWRDGFFCLARLRPDGFAGFASGSASATGTVTTKPLLCSGSRLRVSADAGEGRLRVSVLGGEAHALDRCRPIQANVTDEEVRWDGGQGLGAMKGKQVRLQFELQGARLYSFTFA
jgi:hypothetical protein